MLILRKRSGSFYYFMIHSSPLYLVAYECLPALIYKLLCGGHLVDYHLFSNSYYSDFFLFYFSDVWPSVLTPYYKEDVHYSEHDIKKENEDGISTLFYLQKIYPG